MRISSLLLTEVSSFWFWHGVIPGLLFIGIAVVFEFSDLDLRIALFHYDFPRERWWCLTCWWSNELLHTGGRILTGTVWSVFFGLWLASFRYFSLISFRRPSCYVWLTMASAGGTVTLIKRLTNVDCPWSLSMFDGFGPYIRLFEARPPGSPLTDCFPSAHASAGFAFLSFYFMLRDRHRSWAYVGLILGLFLGFAYGFAQQARGAHFMSHDIWAVAICWFICLGLYKFPFKGQLWSVESK